MQANLKTCKLAWLSPFYLFTNLFKKIWSLMQLSISYLFRNFTYLASELKGFGIIKDFSATSMPTLRNKVSRAFYIL